MQIDTPLILADLMSSLQRFFKIGIYYPAGHPVADQAVASFLGAVDKVAGKEASHIRFTVSETGLSIQGVELDNSQFAVQNFHDLLRTLSISALDIHRDINAEELRLFLSRLLYFQTKIQSSRDFQEMKITGLPSTVTVHQLRFLAHSSAPDGEGSGDCSQPTIDYLLSTLVQQGLTDPQVAMCRRLLDSIPDALRARQVSESDLPSVTWSDVEKLLRNLATALQSPDQNNKAAPTVSHHNIDSLIAILRSLEGETGGGKSRDAVNLLIKMVRNTQPRLPDDEHKRPAPQRRNAQPATTIPELQEALRSLGNTSPPADLLQDTRGEELSILMQMLGREHRLNATMRTQEAFRDCLRAPLADGEWRIVVQGLQHLLETRDRMHVEAALLLMLDTLGRSAHTSTLHLLRDVCQGLPPEGFVTCWPFLVNEAFITGPKQQPELFLEICALIGSLSRQEMHANVCRVEKLKSLREQCIAPALFSPPPAAFNALFQILLNSPQAPYLYEQLILGLRRHPLGWLDKAVTPLLDGAVSSHQQFISDLLKEETPERPSKDLRSKGATIIVANLPALPAEERTAGWVADTITALKKVQVPGSRDMLNTILTARHYLIFPDWPGAARDAAYKALHGTF